VDLFAGRGKTPGPHACRNSRSSEFRLFFERGARHPDCDRDRQGEQDMPKSITVVVIAVAIVAAIQTYSGAQVPPLTTVMQEKAENAQRLLKPIVLADFAGIEQYATRLGRLTYTEVSSWQDRPDSKYLAQANAFMQAVQDLREASRVRDARQASAAYTGLISSCVNCHQLVRAGRSVSLIPPAPVVIPPVSE
jgi:hypothetical protein